MDNFIQNIDINDIIPNTFQQDHNNTEELNNLEESIKQYGIVEPLIVKPNGEKYEIISGNKRFFIAKKLGFETVPALIRNLEKNYYQQKEPISTNKFITNELSIDETKNHPEEKNYIEDLKENRKDEPTKEYQRRISENNKNTDIINLSILNQKELERNDEEMNNQQNIETQNLNTAPISQNNGMPTFGGSFFPSLEDEPTNMNMVGETVPTSNPPEMTAQNPNNNLIDLTDVNNENLNNIPNINTTPQPNPQGIVMNPQNIQNPKSENKFMNLNMNEGIQVQETPIQSPNMNPAPQEITIPNNDVQQVNMNARMQMDMQEPNLNPINNSIMVGVENKDFQVPDLNLNQPSVNIPNTNEILNNNQQFDMTKSVNPMPIIDSLSSIDNSNLPPQEPQPNNIDMMSPMANTEVNIPNIDNNIASQDVLVNNNIEETKPAINPEMNLSTNEKPKDITPVTNCIKNLAENLQNFGYVIHINEEDLGKTSKITIEIEK